MKKKGVELKDYFIKRTQVSVELIPLDITTSSNTNRDIRVLVKQGNKCLIDDYYNVNPCTISCGVRQLSNLPANYDIESWSKYIKKYQITRFTKHLMKEVIDQAKTLNAGFVIASNHQNVSKTKINKIMSSLAKVETDFERNPNSGNDIKIWIL